jgi:pilus assembly protein FimV
MAINKNKVMDAARKARDKGQVDKAIKEYLKIVREDPKDVRVWLKIGDLYAKKGAKAEATETYLRVAKFYSEQGFYLKAVAVYKQILKLDPRLVEVNLKLAELYRQLGLLSDAMQHFEMVAAFFHREGKTREALATIRQLVDLDPENVATRIKLAELYSKEGMVDDAVTEFGQACEYLRKHNRVDDFIKVAERLLWHKPENVPLNRELAGLYLRRSDPRRALQKLQTCFKADQRDVETLGLLAQAFQALDQKGKTVSVLKEMARVLTEVGKTREAEDVHRKILGFAPSDPDSRAFLGEAASQARRTASPPAVAELLEPPAQRPAVRGMVNPTGSLPLVMQSQELDAVLQMDMSSAADEFGLDLGESPSMAGGVLGEGESDLISELSIEAEAYEMEHSESGEAHADEIVKILTETDVYVKYGLHQKAIDHLGKVFHFDPQSREARERLKDILLLQGRGEEAIVELCRLAEQCAAPDPERAETYLREVMRLDANNGRALELAERYRFDLSDHVEIAIGGARAVGDGSGLMGAPPGGTRAAGSGASPARPALAIPGPRAGERDEIDFDDLDLDSDDEVAGFDAAGAGRSYSGRMDDGSYSIDDAAAAPVPVSSHFESDGFDFELPDDEGHEIHVGHEADDGDVHDLASGEVIPDFELGDSERMMAVTGEGGSGATVEVAMDQVEEAVSIADLESDDLDFDAAPVGSDPRGPMPVPPTPLGVPRRRHQDVVGEDLPFDPNDARMFDAEPGFDEEEGVAPGVMGDAPRLGPAPHDVIDSLSEEEGATEGQPLPPELVAPGLAESLEGLEMEAEAYEFGIETGQMVEEAQGGSRTVETAIEQRHDEPTDDERAVAGTSLEDDLDEADFFVAQGLWEEARDILRSLLHRFPGHPLATAKLRDVEAMVAGAEAGAVESGSRSAVRAARVPQSGSRGNQVATALRPARPVVLLENPVEDSDSDTHFDLGLAYKEMGLHDEAIKAFTKVLSSTRREVQSHMMIGLCHREQGNLSEAINQFKAGLYVEKITTSEKFGLYYEIGSCYEDLDDPQEALYYYEMVLKKERAYRDVTERVSGLRAMLGGAGPAGQGGKRPSTLDSETDAALDHLKR